MLNSLNSRSITPPLVKCTDVPQFPALQMAAATFRKDDKLHLKHLLSDAFRCQGLVAVHKTPHDSGQGQRTPKSIIASSSFLLGQSSNRFGNNGNESTSDSRGESGNLQRRIILDYSRQHVTGETMELLFDLADRMGLTDRMNEMRSGYKINFTERRAVMHHVLRMPKRYNFKAHHPKGDIILDEVHSVLERISSYTRDVREGRVRGCTGKEFRNIVCIGAGGNIPGAEAVYEALRGDPSASQAVRERSIIRFLANVDPVDFDLCTRDLNPEETLIIVSSKSFATPETLLNMRSIRRWLVRNLCPGMPRSSTPMGEENKNIGDTVGELSEALVISKHFCAVTMAQTEAEKFGIKHSNIFPIWDWVGGRFSVWSAVGMLPLSLHYSYNVMERFLDGAHDIDEHFFDAPLGGNIPVLLGLLGVWNSTFMGYHTRAVLPYSHALRKFPSVVQKFDMESNGKRVTAAGMPLLFHAGEIDFGDAGTNAQHNFYQLLHQGRPVPTEFIGFMESQSHVDEEHHNSGKGGSFTDGRGAELELSSHDELMSNFFAQPDALATGKTLNELVQEGVPAELRQHKVFPGNRPSSSMLMTKLDAFAVGQLFAIYEHRTVVQGFIWGINSFDQYGSELVNIHAKRVKAQLSASRTRGASVQGFNSSSGFLLEAYLSHGKASR